MHILATFATLCCQTRWARNHSCTTQEHVSFFRTFSGTRQKPTGQNRTFSEISTFSTFSSNLTKCSKTVRKHKKHKFLVRTCSQKLFLVRACSRKYFVKCANVQNCAEHKSTILQNVRKTVVHKMRKSAAQIIFQMQKSQIRKSALCTILSVQVFRRCTNCFSVTKYFLCM